MESQSEMHVGKCRQCGIQTCVQCPFLGLFRKITSFWKNLFLQQMAYGLGAYTSYSGSRNSSRYTYSIVACVSILPPLTRSYNSAQLTQLIQLGKISNFRPCFQINVHATQVSLLNSSSSAYNLYNLTYLSQRT